ncbi:MAG: FtsQ-type POTRA domain-containing protein [Alicyclobacillus sp.]|nr:FtsQ-type POTRA domain-containing protein [Alicyclobacillus sp.]
MPFKSTTTPALQAAPGRGRRTRVWVTAFFLLIGLVVVLESPITRVRALAVAGNVSLPAQQILAASGLHTGLSLWQVNPGAVQQAVMQQLPLVQAVEVHTDLRSGTVTLTVHERRIVAVLAPGTAGGTWYNLLDNGVVYNMAVPSSGFVHPVVSTDGTPSVHPGDVPSPEVASVCQALAQFAGDGAPWISEIHVDRYGTATVYMTNGFAAQCNADQLQARLLQLRQAVQYFLSQGYAPGLVDMTGQPPFRYTPYPVQAGQASSGSSVSIHAGSSSQPVQKGGTP